MRDLQAKLSDLDTLVSLVFLVAPDGVGFKYVVSRLLPNGVRVTTTLPTTFVAGWN